MTNAQKSTRKVFSKFAPLEGLARYKGAYGGRGSGKSHNRAEAAVFKAAERTSRIICLREVQKTLRQSVYQLICDKIAALNLGYYFDVRSAEIRTHYNDSLISFAGMQSYNAENIKSLEGYDIGWFEEAQTCSAHSLKMLRPTFRKDPSPGFPAGSELWFTWNPRFRSDAVDAFFRNPPIHPDAISVMVNWRDNPYFPEVSMRDKDHDFAEDPDNALHVWEGEYGMIRGAILGRWVNKAYGEGRIHDDVLYDPDGQPIEISSDLGRRDTASWWFWQREVGGYKLIDYDEGSGLDAAEWVVRLQRQIKEKEYSLGRIYLPHDARTKTFSARYSAIEIFVKGDPDRDVRGFGANKLAIVPATSVEDRINAARTIIRRCAFNETACQEGINGLEAWEYEWDEENEVFRKVPLHNWASHPSDGYSYGCQVMENLPAPESEQPEPRFFPQVTADEVFFPEPKGHEATEHV